MPTLTRPTTFRRRSVEGPAARLDTAYRLALEKMLAAASDPRLKEQIRRVLAEKEQG